MPNNLNLKKTTSSTSLNAANSNLSEAASPTSETNQNEDANSASTNGNGAGCWGNKKLTFAEIVQCKAAQNEASAKLTLTPTPLDETSPSGTPVQTSAIVAPKASLGDEENSSSSASSTSSVHEHHVTSSVTVSVATGALLAAD